MVQGSFYLLKNPSVKQNVIHEIQAINTQDKLWCVKVEEFKEKRSQRQNRYLWGWVYRTIVDQLNASGQIIQLDDGREMEWTPELLHEAFKTVFLALPPIKTKRGELKQYQSTASLSKKDFNEYLDSIDRACANWWVGIHVPAPVGLWKDILEDS